jgi:hypothetical protein
MAKLITPHQERINQELLAAGATRTALYKPQLRKLHQTIHPDEHIAAVVYPNLGSGTAVLVATDRRILYIDRKPFSYVFDEFTYDIVSGVSFKQQGPLFTLLLHTPINHFVVHTTNRVAVQGFITCMEIRKIEHLASHTSATTLPRTT